MRLWIWGENISGEMGDGTDVNRSSPVQTITLGSTWKSVKGGRSITVALKDDGSLWTWGDGADGALGNLSTNDVSSPVHIAQGKTWKSIGGCSKTNESTACAIDSNNKLFTWGENNEGQLGHNDVIDKSSPTQMGTKNWSSASINAVHGAAIDTDNKLFLWGNNYSGQLGLNDAVDRSSPVQLGTDNWDMIATGYHYTLGIKSNGTLWGWGANDVGQLGLGDTVFYSSPVQIGNASDWKFVEAGIGHSAAIKNDNSLFVWGYAGYGALGQNNTTNRSSPVQVSSSWDEVSCGYAYTVALRSDNTVWAWGYNSYGQLGDDTDVNKSSPVQIYGQASGWKAVSAGLDHAVALANELPPSKSCSSLTCSTPAFKCYVGVTESCACARWKFYTAQCTRIQQSLGICSGTSGAYVPAITVCNQKLL